MEFLLRDYNRDVKPDLYCINKKGENNFTEVKILNGVSNFKEFILDIKSDLYSIDNFEFCAGVYKDYECIFGIKKWNSWNTYICYLKFKYLKNINQISILFINRGK